MMRAPQSRTGDALLPPIYADRGKVNDRGGALSLMGNDGNSVTCQRVICGELAGLHREGPDSC